MLLEGLCRRRSRPLILIMEIAICRMFRDDMPAQVEQKKQRRSQAKSYAQDEDDARAGAHRILSGTCGAVAIDQR